MKAIVFLTLLSLGFLPAPRLLLGESLQFTTIDFPGAVGTFAEGVNNAGQIVGTIQRGSGNFVGFLYTNGTFTTFEVPGTSGTTNAHGINDAGQIVGSVGGTRSQGYLEANGVFTDIYYPNSFSTSARQINNAGQITTYVDFVGSFLYRNGVFTPINVPNTAPLTAQATGINNRGQIVGSFGFADDVQGFLDTDGVVTTFGFPGAFRTYPTGINDAGEIVGYYEVNGSVPGEHGFLYENGSFTSFDVPGANTSFVGAQVLGVNNAGQIVGVFGDSSNSIHGFLATPVPEPASLLLLAGGLAGLGLWKRMRQNPATDADQ